MSRQAVFETLNKLGISYELFEHPPLPTIEEALVYWKDIESTHCKNLFFRNHKGNRHYLVIIEHTSQLGIHGLEKKLRQGKLSFASPERMMRYLGVTPGSVSLFGLINDKDHHVHLFLDAKLKTARRISFHPNDNTASVVIPMDGFYRFLEWAGNSYEYIDFTTAGEQE
jgi:Ala-tRNA(Pro) deacylase